MTLTLEQQRNAILYGACPICGTPQEVHLDESEEDGKRIVIHGLIAPCGHQQITNEVRGYLV